MKKTILFSLLVVLTTGGYSQCESSPPRSSYGSQYNGYRSSYNYPSYNYYTQPNGVSSGYSRSWNGYTDYYNRSGQKVLTERNYTPFQKR